MNDQGEVAYKIDKRRRRYTNICASHASDSEDDDDVDRLAIELAQKAVVAARSEENYTSIEEDEDSMELVIVHPENDTELFEQERMIEPINHFLSGDVRAVQKYLETSSDARLFVQGRYPDGQTNLIVAAIDQSSAMVALLIEHGAQINAVNNSGRTALMEAALFDRADNVKVLLELGADKKIRDNENRPAIDFAQNDYKKRRERYARAYLYNIDDTPKIDTDREEIVRLLGGENWKSKNVFGRPPTLLLPTPYSSKRSPIQNSLVPITSDCKMVARLERGGKFPSIGAMSGWFTDSVQSIRVDGRQWMDDVFYISKGVGHYLPYHWEDQCQDKKGHYNACHAEKQLIAYFIDRHVFLPRDGLPNLKLEEEIKLKEGELQELYSSTEAGRQVTSLRKTKKEMEHGLVDGNGKVERHNAHWALDWQLKSVETPLNRLIASPQARPFLEVESRLEVLNQRLRRHTDLIDMAITPPPASLTEAVILISSPPCRDCIMFKDKVNEFFGLSIQFFAAV